MTELNLSLWIAGCALILGVLFYNFWQEYKAKKNVERAFGQHQDDVLMQAEEVKSGSLKDRNGTTNGAYNAMQRQEPSLDGRDGRLADAVVEPQEAQLDTSITSTPDAEPESESLLPVDDFIDAVISMEFETSTRGDKIMSEIQSFRRVGNKPVHFIGVTLAGKRETIIPATSYTQLVAGVQLVTRSGALNELEYSELVMKLRQIADNLNAYPDIPDMKHVTAAGRDLHLFVTEHDAQLSVNVHTNSAPWGISTLLIALERHGFDTRPDGRLVMLDGEGGALFTLFTNCGVSEQTTKRITLLLDVPCVAPERDGFKAMVSCAKSLAVRLGGTVVDDGNGVLSDATLNQIQEQVDSFYASMQAAEIPAGSIRASRIFA